MIYLDLSSIELILYSSIVFISFILHQFIFIPLIKRTISYLSLYIIIISLLILTDLPLIYLDNQIIEYILLIIDSILTGALFALLVCIYSYSWCIFHLILTIIVVFLGNFSPKNDILIDHWFEDALLMFISFLHILYCFLNGFRTYMHRLVALSGMCLSFYLLVVERLELHEELSIHSIQSIRAFLLYSIVICVRQRTSYW